MSRKLEETSNNHAFCFLRMSSIKVVYVSGVGLSVAPPARNWTVRYDFGGCDHRLLSREGDRIVSAARKPRRALNRLLSLLRRYIFLRCVATSIWRVVSVRISYPKRSTATGQIDLVALTELTDLWCRMSSVVWIGCHKLTI